MAPMNKSVIVKINLGSDIRRFTASPDSLSWAIISKRAAESFDLPAKKLRMTYVDDENDRITITSNEELAEAVNLALSSNPAVLRLSVQTLDDAEAGPQVDKATPPPESATASMAASATADVATFVDTIAKQLPAVFNQLPDSVRKLIPHAELDVAATIAANAAQAAANAANHVNPCHATGNGANNVPVAADPYVKPHKAGAREGVHEGVSCDKSGMSPIVGIRYHLIGHDYDLCEAEFAKLDDKERLLFQKVMPPAAANNAPPADPAAETEPTAEPTSGIHRGVQCDRSGMLPIVGTRFNLRGHNYDLCQAEFDKLSPSEKALYDAIPPPTSKGAAGCAGFGPWRAHCRGGWGRAWGGARPPVNAMGGGMCGPPAQKLAARFVRDVTVFDGTQVAPGTQFTKIWRLKNNGEVPWPPGTRMVFVGGDQMTTEMSVSLGRESPVMPAEEVDVAVEMTAPMDHGRYLGYWRLTGPFGRRKWGQRVWCHVQVVDPSAPPAANSEDFERTLADIEKIKSNLTAGDADDDTEAPPPPAAAATAGAVAADGSAAGSVGSVASSAAEVGEMTVKATELAGAKEASFSAQDTEMREAPSDTEMLEAASALPSMWPGFDSGASAPPETSAPISPPVATPREDADEDGASDDGVLVTEKMIAEVTEADTSMEDATAMASAVPSVQASLEAMGFTDAAMIAAVIAKHGEDIEACARDLAAATEWDSLLDDLAEMGFGNRELNKTLMMKNDGNIKRTVRDLVEA